MIYQINFPYISVNDLPIITKDNYSERLFIQQENVLLKSGATAFLKQTL